MRLKKYIIESTMFSIGDRVEGKYIDGSKFIGSIESRRFHSYNSNTMIYTIKLDKAYKGRDKIMINWDVRKNKPKNDAILKHSNKKLSKSTMDSQKKRELKKLYDLLDEIPKVFGKGPKANAAKKEIEDEICKLTS